MSVSSHRPPGSGGRIDSLDFLRGLAILYVIAFLHPQDYISFQYLDHRAYDEATACFLGVFVFISGYLLDKNNAYLTEAGGVKRYFKKRFLRIYPLYLLALAVFTLFSFISWKSLLVHGLFLNMLIGKSVPTLWFVSMICCYYLFFPAIARNYRFSKTLFLTAAIFLILAGVHFLSGLIDIRLITYLPLFSFGVLASQGNWVERGFQRQSVLLWSLAAFGALSFAFILTDEHSFYSLPLRTSLAIAVMPFMTALGAAGASVVSRTFYARIAYASFCMYLFHRVLFYLMMKAWNPGNNAYIMLYLLVIGLPLLYFIAFSFQTQYDRLTARSAR
jgi:peptidoglycan/LPS O-acetylase OafA/YrhL